MDYFSIIIGVIILDSISLGFFIYIFRIFPPYRKLLKDGVIFRDTPCNFMPYFSNGHGHYRELILTRDHLILRNSVLTSAGNIESSAIKQYQMKEAKSDICKITLFFMFNRKECKLSFKSKHSKEWKNALQLINVQERT